MENKVRIMKNINSFPYLKNYGWKKLEDKSKKKEDQTKQKVDKKLEERRLQKPNQIRGYCVDILLNDLNKLFEGISDAPHHKSIWMLQREILALLSPNVPPEPTDLDRILPDNIITDFKLEYLCVFVREFHTRFLKQYAFKSKSRYIHILFHMPMVMQYFWLQFNVSLVQLSNEGFEHTHYRHRSVFTRLFNNGGGHITTVKPKFPTQKYFYIGNGDKFIIV